MWFQFRVLAKVVPKSSKGSWDLIWRLVLHSFMLGHYTAFLAFDVRFLLRRWLHWRHVTSELVVYNKE